MNGDLNDMMRQTGDPTYYTPMAVVGQLVNQNGGQVTIINPPFVAEKPKPKKWIKKWRMFGLFFAVSNGRLKKRDERYYKGGWKGYVDVRQDVFEAQGHKCPHCGKEVESFKDLEAHHILPWSRFSELRNKRENIILLCHKCHKEVHCNPYINIHMMEDKAKELGIDLKERYSHAYEECEGEVEGTAEV